jgi:hypothetical protein
MSISGISSTNPVSLVAKEADLRETELESHPAKVNSTDLIDASQDEDPAPSASAKSVAEIDPVLAGDLHDLQDALSMGDLAAAKEAISKIQRDMKLMHPMANQPQIVSTVGTAATSKLDTKA